jgi:hypothetical protein
VLKGWNEDEVPMIDIAIEDVLQLMFCTF